MKKSILKKFKFIATEKTGKVAALYVRVSQDEFVNGADGKKEQRASVQTQRASLIAAAKAKSWGYKLYENDCDISGSEEIANRPAMTELIADIKAGKIHTVMCRDIKRLYRNQALQSDFIYKVLIPAGVEIISLTEQIDIASSEGQLMLGIKAWQAQQDIIYSATHSTTSRENLASKGQLRTKPAIGYRIQEIDGIRSCYIKEKEADIVRLIFNMFNASKSVKNIALHLVNSDIKTRRGAFLWTSTIIRILRNKVYTGMIDYNGKINLGTPYPAIIDKAVYDKAQLVFKTHIRNKTGNGGWKAKAPLLSGILKCGYCYDKIIDDAYKAKDKLFPNMVSTATVWRYKGAKNTAKGYTCQTRFKNHAINCPESISIKADKIEGFLKDFICDPLFSKIQGQGNTGEDNLVAEIKALEKKITGLKDRQKKALTTFALNTSKEFNPADLNLITKTIRDEINKQEKTLADLNARHEKLTNDTQRKAVKALQGWDSLDMIEKKKHLNDVLQRILLYKDRLELHLFGGKVVVPVVRGYIGSNGYHFVKENAKLFLDGVKAPIPFFTDIEHILRLEEIPAP